MTKEDILRTLKSILAEINESENAVCYVTSEDREVIKSAIKALEQEPCEDCISRQAVLEGKIPAIISGQAIDVIPVHFIKQLPLVQSKPIECEDCISRAELLKAIDTWDKFGLDDTNHLFRLDNLSLPYYVPYIHYDDVIKCIKGMPSVQPKTVSIPKEATNGDVLCMLFPNMHYTLSDTSQRVVTTIGVASSFDLVWWNASYQSEVSE